MTETRTDWAYRPYELDAAPSGTRARESAEGSEAVLDLRDGGAIDLRTSGLAGDGSTGSSAGQGQHHAVGPRPNRVLARTFDIAVAAAGLLLTTPLMCVVALLVRLSSPGPVIYASPRIGQGYAELRIWKFRSMYLDAEDRLAALLESSPQLRAEYETYRKLKSDPRVTRVGNVIRRLSIDELPQLVNVLRGDMSIVGPRPKLPNEQSNYGQHLEEVLSVRPGLTGLWQVSGRNRLTLDERVSLDLEYVRTRSLRLDIRICARTSVQLLQPHRHGAI